MMRLQVPDAKESAVRVVACIVTYNRAALLRRLLIALETQSYPVARVIVIDNASEDNTAQVVEERMTRGFEQIRYQRLPQNCGGAGGFAAAIDLAMAEDAPPPTHLWLMDDDGYPDTKCLERLLYASEVTEYSALNPVVWAEPDAADGAQELAFPGLTDERESLLSAVESGNAICVPNLVRFFNGSLLDAKMVKKVGTPIAEFFIWGDEVEYFYRIQRLGYSVATVANANYFHPKNRQVYRRYKLGRLSWVIPLVAPERRYFMVRNFSYIAHQYGGMSRWFLHTAKWLIFGAVNPVLILRWAREGLEMSRKRESGRPWE